MTTDEVRDLSPFYNRRTDEFGGSVEGRARVLRLIREAVAERAGADFSCTVKVPDTTLARGDAPTNLRDNKAMAERLRREDPCRRWQPDCLPQLQPMRAGADAWHARRLLQPSRQSRAASEASCSR
jgi:2,4-dienoyl-CoA reductase-like NADH-dependent reductase (Old Yellow Enzyme family)